MSGNSVTINPHGAGVPDDVLVGADAFYPDLSTNEFRDAMRVDSTVPNQRVKLTLINAALKTNVELLPLKSANSEYAKLEDMPSGIITTDAVEKSALMHHYKTAVFNEAKANITEVYRDFDSTKSGHDEADKLEITIDDYRRTAREHIRTLLGKPRATIKIL